MTRSVHLCGILTTALLLAALGCGHEPSATRSAAPPSGVGTGFPTPPRNSGAAGGTKGAAQGESGFAVGQIANEIEGEDIDGKHFKLSDYRGKVVLLDFWGNW